jgi:hypothetical protein
MIFLFLLNKNFNKDNFKSIIDMIIKNNINEFVNINDNCKLQPIKQNDITNDIFLNGKKILPIIDNNKSLNNILFTYSYGSVYYSIQISIKINDKIYQIIELLFWRNEIISNTIYLKDFEINKCIFFQTNEFKILLPNIIMLLKTNIISLKFRLQNNEFNKCSKDYYRLKFIEMINIKNLSNNEIIKDEYITLLINDTNKIYKKDNPNLFKFPYSICSLNDINEQKNFFNLYNKFLNLNLNEQFEILTSEKHID